MNTPKTMKELDREIRLSNVRLVLKWMAGIAVACIAFSGYNAATTPTSYADCLLSEVKAAQNDLAAYAVAESCSRRFPANQSRRPLPWYRHPLSHYNDGNECVIHETAGISDPPQIVNGSTMPSGRVQLIAVACYELY